MHARDVRRNSDLSNASRDAGSTLRSVESGCAAVGPAAGNIPELTRRDWLRAGTGAGVVAGLSAFLPNLFLGQRSLFGQQKADTESGPLSNRKPPESYRLNGRPADRPRSTEIESSGLKYITPATQQAIERGLAYLAHAQREDGSFGSGSMYRQNAAITALAGISFLAGGHTPGRGKYGQQVNQAAAFLIANAEQSGYLHSPETHIHGPMYEHGFATLFLAELYGMSPRDDLREALKKAISVIVNSQNRDGGWRYHPIRKDADVSVTVCQIMALRAARNAGLDVPKETVDRCIQYVKQCQNSDGGFKYQTTQGSPSVFARSAAGLVALYSAGIYEGREVDKALKFLTHFTPRGDVFRGEQHYFYGHYYAVQAMWQAGDEYWNRWFPAIRDELLARQSPDGSWIDLQVCPEYGAAMACIILQIPNNYLPIFQR